MRWATIIDFRSEIEEDVPAEVLDKVLKIPYCIQAYDPNGLDLDQFNTHPATVATVDTLLEGLLQPGGIRRRTYGRSKGGSTVVSMANVVL